MFLSASITGLISPGTPRDKSAGRLTGPFSATQQSVPAERRARGRVRIKFYRFAKRRGECSRDTPRRQRRHRRRGGGERVSASQTLLIALNCRGTSSASRECAGENARITIRVLYAGGTELTESPTKRYRYTPRHKLAFPPLVSDISHPCPRIFLSAAKRPTFSECVKSGGCCSARLAFHLQLLYSFCPLDDRITAR